MKNDFISNNLQDEYFMNIAIEEAAKAEGFAHPNPLVGAVIVKGGNILAKGFHRAFGSLHAERDALKNAYSSNASVAGATMYVTLEPCCHTGKQPPCTDAIIQSGIRRVVTGSPDPNPLVNGGGIATLKNAGITVTQNVLKERCDSLNEIFFHYIKSHRPFVILKYACTADGKTAPASGTPGWISCKASRENVHKTRANVMAVMVGVDTVLQDNPSLTVRRDDTKHFQPERIVMDSNLRTPLHSRLVQSAEKVPLTICCTPLFTDAKKQKKEALEAKGVTVLTVGEDGHGRICIDEALALFAKRGIDSILVESGGTLAASFLFPPTAQKIQCYVCPKIFGESPYSPARGLGIKNAQKAVKLSKPTVTVFEDDVLLEYKILGSSQRV